MEAARDLTAQDKRNERAFVSNLISATNDSASSAASWRTALPCSWSPIEKKHEIIPVFDNDAFVHGIARSLYVPLPQTMLKRLSFASQITMDGSANCRSARCTGKTKAANTTNRTYYERIDMFGDHFQNCQELSKFRTIAHTTLRNTVDSIISSNTSARVKTEVPVRQAMSENAIAIADPGALATDITVSPVGRGISTHIDFAIISSTKAGLFPKKNRHGREIFNHLMESQAIKHNHYSSFFAHSKGAHRFLPVIISSQGRWAEKSLAGMKALLHDCLPALPKWAKRDADQLTPNSIINMLQRAAGALAITSAWERATCYREIINEKCH